MTTGHPPEARPGHEVPAEVVDLSRAAFTLHDPSLPVAVLSSDSLLDAELPLPEGALRRLLFEHGDLWVDVTLRRLGGTTELHVRVVRETCTGDDPDAGGDDDGVEPVACDFAELLTPSARIKIPLVAGEGTLAAVPAGLTSLVVRPPAGTAPATLRTAWFTV